jgi:rhodanese-related sulfurtransferase
VAAEYCCHPAFSLIDRLLQLALAVASNEAIAARVARLCRTPPETKSTKVSEMLRNRSRSLLLAWVLLACLLNGCAGAPALTPGAASKITPGPLASSGTPAPAVAVVPGGSGRSWEPDPSLVPALTSYLAAMPEGWGLLPAQSFASKKSYLIDVRQPEEYQKGFIDGAINIPLRELVRNVGALPAQDQAITVVCDNGARSAVAMVTLQLLGWKGAKSLYGGLKGWQEAKQTLVTAPIPQKAAGAQVKVDTKIATALETYLSQGLAPDYGQIDAAKLGEELTLTPFEELVDPEVWAQGPPMLIDVSEPAEFAKGSISSAVNMPFRGLPGQKDQIPWKTPTVVVCGVENHLTTLDRTYKYIVTICPNGHRAAIAMMTLQLLGFRDVHALAGGIKTWKDAGLK